jgi:acyl-CoA synthetase (AMP-forming)/AMP-acid ligase II
MLEIPGLNLGIYPWYHARARGDNTAYIFQGREVSWAEFEKRVTKVCDALIKSGLKKGDKVGLLALNSIETLEVMFGTIRAGGVLVPLSPLLTPNLMVSLLKDAGAKYFFVASPLNDLAAVLAAQLDIIPAENQVAIGIDADGYVDYEDLIATGENDQGPLNIEDNDECVIIYSSGTTGVPKGIVHTHKARILTGLMCANEFRINNTATVLISTPLFTNATWAMILSALVTGAKVVLQPMFTVEGFFADVANYNISHVFLVPTLYHTVLEHPEFDQHDLSSLEIMVSMGSTLPLPWKKKLLEKMGHGLIELYGLTEGIATTLKPEYVMDKTGSVGTPVSGCDIGIIDDDGNELPWGEVGEIVGYGTSLMKHYHNRPDATADIVWKDKFGRTYIKTGDIGRFDEDGFLYIMDRKKDMIVTGGINVFAKDIEEVILGHPDVNETAVIAVPHEKWIETPLALVILREGAGITEEELKIWINERVTAKHQRVNAVEFRTDPFPRNALGKLLKKDLREKYWVGVEK